MYKKRVTRKQFELFLSKGCPWIEPVESLREYADFMTYVGESKEWGAGKQAKFVLLPDGTEIESNSWGGLYREVRSLATLGMIDINKAHY